jgi:hypothetical protein
VVNRPGLVRRLILTGTGPAGGKDIDKVAGTTYSDMLRAVLTRSDPKEFLFFNRNAAGKSAARAFVNRLKERTADRDVPIKIKAFQTQLKAIKKWGRSAPADLSTITHPTLIANGDNDRMVPSVLSTDLHHRIKGSELIIYPDSGHGGLSKQDTLPRHEEGSSRRRNDTVREVGSYSLVLMRSWLATLVVTANLGGHPWKVHRSGTFEESAFSSRSGAWITMPL